ncbi:hypothetical protein SRHO_G00255180 [Serrasalmus rhombeus]
MKRRIHQQDLRGFSKSPYKPGRVRVQRTFDMFVLRRFLRTGSHECFPRKLLVCSDESCPYKGVQSVNLNLHRALKAPSVLENVL